MKKSVILFALPLIFLGGCESSQDMFKRQQVAQEQQTKADAQEQGVRCEMMSRTGSNRKTKVCRTLKQIEHDEQVAQNTLKRLNKPEITRSK